MTALLSNGTQMVQMAFHFSALKHIFILEGLKDWELFFCAFFVFLPNLHWIPWTKQGLEEGCKLFYY